MKALGKTLGRRGFSYVVVLTMLVGLGGAAGMYVLERETGNIGFSSYSESLGGRLCVMTTLGSEAWPQTGEGRLLCFALALYAFTVFGYVTATLATFFVGRDAENQQAEIVGAQEIRELRQEIRGLREELRLSASPQSGNSDRTV
jgi:voltage-gated potassium channel